MPSLNDLSAYRFEGHGEQAIREGWIAPLLGYRIDTLNEIEYEQSVALRHPVRLLASHRLRVNYKPTVLRRGLWLIEAKAPGEIEDWQKHLGQAWSYATHPEINVPLVAIADGSRIAVYDVTVPEWDEAILDIPTHELATRFSDLANVLGARQVATFVRRRQLQRLAIALRAEIDPAVLDDTIEEVKAIVKAARPSVQENRKLIVDDQVERNRRAWEQVVGTTGLYGIAQHHNGPLAVSLNDVDRAVQVLTGDPPVARRDSFERLLSAARVPADGPVCAWWPLRALRLAVALRVRHEDGCEDFAEDAIQDAARDHLLGFPTDPLARAAHRLERSLPVLLARLVCQPTIDLPAVEARAKATIDPELWLRMPVTAEQLARDNVNFGSRRLWLTSEWTEQALNDKALEIERLIRAIADPPDRYRLMGHQFDDTTLRWDDLIGYTVIFVDLYGNPADVPEVAWPTIETQVGAPGRVDGSARRLLAGRTTTGETRE
jgi:hypothetical protein